MPALIQWLVDTRPLFPSAKRTCELPQAAPRAMALLSPPEAAAVLRYHFLADAKLALLSALLKRLAIARFLDVPWSQATPVRDARTKPVFYLPGQAPRSEPLLFNVSHQAGVVTLLAALRPERPGADAEEDARAAVGVDVVCPAERRARDRETIRTRGWAHFVEIHEDVLCPREVRRLCEMGARRNSSSSSSSSSSRNEKEKEKVSKDTGNDSGDSKARIDGVEGNMDDDTLLEYFYALWCLREAWVKMTGHALLAEWLSELEMRNWKPPPKDAARATTDEETRTVGGGTTTSEQARTQGGDTSVGGGNQGDELEVWFRGERVRGVDVRIERWGEHMIATAVRGAGMERDAFERLEWEDVLAQAEGLKAREGASLLTYV